MEASNVKSFKKVAAVNLDRYLEFCIGAEEYAIPLLMVREVISVPETTPIPKSPPHFLGIMNLRGQVISVVDMRKKLKIVQKNESDKDEAVIIVDIGGLNIGVVVDSINKVLAFSKEELCEMPEVDQQINTKYILGVYKKDHSLTILLDIAKVLDVQDMQTLTQQKEAA
jgi:purine-binding chemotaxis protein CheW